MIRKSTDKFSLMIYMKVILWKLKIQLGHSFTESKASFCHQGNVLPLSTVSTFNLNANILKRSDSVLQGSRTGGDGFIAI